MTHPPIDRPPITHVAIRFQGKIYSLPKPNRHHDVIRLILDTCAIEHVDASENDQGFLDESGCFLNRRQALFRARLHGQVKDEKKIRLRMLFSEDVW